MAYHMISYIGIDNKEFVHDKLMAMSDRMVKPLLFNRLGAQSHRVANAVVGVVAY